jgi:hypothetical protein
LWRRLPISEELLTFHEFYYHIRPSVYGRAVGGAGLDQVDGVGKDVRPNDLSNLLHDFAELQSEKGIVPPIFDYDQPWRQ